MSGSKSAKKQGTGKAGAVVHICATCPEVATPEMHEPGRKMLFRCKAGHLTKKGSTRRPTEE